MKPTRVSMLALASTAIFVIALVGLAVAFVWPETHRQFQQYDDEGYVMMSMRRFLDGHRLYDDVLTQYGPFYYFVHAPYYSRHLAGLTHDSVRMETMMLWLGTAAVSGLAIWRMTRSLVGSGLGFALVTVSLGLTTNEPGHPQGLCGLIVALSLLVMTFETPVRERWLGLVLGLTIAFTVMTKVNVGVFLGGGLFLASLLPGATRGRLAASILVAVGLLALPAILMRSQLTFDWALALYARFATTFTVAVAVLACRSRDWRRRGLAPWLVGGAVAGSLVVVLATLAAGTSLAGLWHGLVGQHTRFADVFFLELEPGNWKGWVHLAAGVIFGIAYASGVIQPSRFMRIAKGMFVVWILSKTVLGIDFAKMEFANLGIMRALPWTWLLMVPRNGANEGDEEPRDSYARASLMLLCPLMLMIVYPVAGTQRAFAMFPTVLAIVICGCDTLRDLAGWAVATRPALRMAPSLVTATLAFVLLGRACLGSLQIYRENVPLGLPGASRLRLPADQVYKLRWLAERVRDDCDTFVTLPGFSSLYFWTGKTPPTSLNTGAWMRMLNDRQQAEVVRALDDYPRVVAVRNWAVAEIFLRDRELPPGPLVRYIDGLETDGERGGYEILRRPPLDGLARTPADQGLTPPLP